MNNMIQQYNIKEFDVTTNDEKSSRAQCRISYEGGYRPEDVVYKINLLSDKR